MARVEVAVQNGYPVHEITESTNILNIIVIMVVLALKIKDCTNAEEARQKRDIVATTHRKDCTNEEVPCHEKDCINREAEESQTRSAQGKASGKGNFD